MKAILIVERRDRHPDRLLALCHDIRAVRKHVRAWERALQDMIWSDAELVTNPPRLLFRARKRVEGSEREEEFGDPSLATEWLESTEEESD